MSQSETARELHTTRANVSMIEHRARTNVERAKDTISAFQSTLTNHLVIVPKGTRAYDIPSFVLREGDRSGIHLQSNIVEIVRMVKEANPPCLASGKTNRRLSFVFNQKGKLTLTNSG
jgi:Tfx family DNA-binding protein